MKKSVRYTLLVILIIGAAPIFIALFTDYEINKWVMALSYVIIFGSGLITTYLLKKKKEH